MVGRCAAKLRVAWTKTVCSESFVSFSAPSGATSPRKRAANAGASRGVCGSAARIDASSSPRCSRYAELKAPLAVAAPPGG
jgi:hypothetical protein